jgi:hypothetical protein
VPRAVAVVEEVLHAGVVGGEHGEGERLLGVHRLELQDAGRRFLGRAHHALEEVGTVQDHAAHQLGAVVYDQVRSRLDGAQQIPLEVFLAGVVGGEDPHPPLGQGGTDVVLGRERIAPRDSDVGPRLREQYRQIGGLCLQVDGHRYSFAAQGTVGEPPLEDGVQDGRMLGDPVYLAVTLEGEGGVLYDRFLYHGAPAPV